MVGPGPSLIQRYSTRARKMPRARTVAVKHTANLLAEYDFQQGASADTVYDLTGTYNATRGSGGSFKPTWTSAGLTWDGTTLLVEYPAGLSQLIKTDIWCWKNQRLPSNSETYQGISVPWWQMTDGRPMVASGLTGELYSPAESQFGSVIFAQTYGSGGKMYWGNRETKGYHNSSTYDMPTLTTHFWGGIHTSGLYPMINGSAWYYRLCYSEQLTTYQITSTMRWVQEQVEARGVTVGDTTAVNAPVIAAWGDSITGGVGANTEYLHILTGLLSTNIRNRSFGVGGSNSASMLSRVQSMVSNVFSQTTGIKIGIIASGVNDILGNITPSTVVSQMSTAVDAIQSAGGIACVITPCRCDWTSQRASQAAGDTDHNTLCEAIKAGDTGADLVVDLTGGVLGYGSDLSQYRDDRVHPNAAGHAVIAAGLDTAVGTVGVT